MKIPTAIPNVGALEGQYLQECITTEMVSTVGPFVDRFEKAVAEACGVDLGIATSAGTTALHAALTGFGIGHGDLVMMPSLTFIATANSIRHAGATPYIIDCRRDDWTFDFDLCRSVLERETVAAPEGRLHTASGKLIKAIMPVLVMGQPVDLAAAAQIRREFGVRVIVDGAAAIGTEWMGQKLGKSEIDALCISFNGNKTVTCGGGGAILCPNPEDAKRLKHLVSTARTGANYDHDMVGFNFRMTNVQAAIGCAQMERLASFLEAKARISAAYDAFADRHACLSRFPLSAYGKSSHWFSGFWYNGSSPALADEFRAHMQSANIDLRKFWKPVHQQTPYLNDLRTAMDNCEDIWWRIFTMPCSTNIKDEELAYVLEQAAIFWDAHG